MGALDSLILKTAVRFLTPLLLLFSLFLLLRGHNEPGGGFVGGLVAASAFLLHGIAFSMRAARRALKISPPVLIASGLLIAVASGILGLLMGQAFLTGLWTEIGLSDAPGATFSLTIGTPVVFDIGVYLVVVGIATLIVFSVAEEETAS